MPVGVRAQTAWRGTIWPATSCVQGLSHDATSFSAVPLHLHVYYLLPLSLLLMLLLWRLPVGLGLIAT